MTAWARNPLIFPQMHTLASNEAGILASGIGLLAEARKSFAAEAAKDSRIELEELLAVLQGKAMPPRLKPPEGIEG